jgi:iron complex transport system ATP-binding protein
MLEARNLSYAIGGREIVRSLSTGFEPSRLHLVVGPNGAGKSTFVKLLAGALSPSAGTVTYEGRNSSSYGALELARCRAVLSQSVDIAFPLSVREVVMMGRYPHFGARPGAADLRVCDEVMEHFEIVELAGRGYATLSGGERQRVNFARVLAQVWLPLPGRLRYLFLDEPLTFLDVRHQIDFMRKIRRFADAADVVTVGVVHDLGLAARFADRLIVLDGGALAAQGSPREVLNEALLRSVFGVEPIFLSSSRGSDLHLVFE